MEETIFEKQEILQKHVQLVNIRFPTISCFLLLILVFKTFFNVPFPPPLIFLVALMLITTLTYSFIFDLIKKPSPSLVINAYFAYMLFDLVNLSIVIYFLGGVIWIGFVFYAFMFILTT